VKGFFLYRNDLKQILRDPVMRLLLFAPVLMISVFKLILVFFTPFLLNKLNFDLTIYYHYFLSGVLVLIAGMMGIVTGFVMIDERDGRISELLSVTPLGERGYLINRLLFAAIPVPIYSVISIYLLGIITIPFLTVIILSLILSIYSSVIGLLIFLGAGDKVKGLTYAKGLNSIGVFAFTDLFSMKWLTILSYIFPPYWITQIIDAPDSSVYIIISVLVTLAWLSFLITRYLTRKQI
jgi:fluoroquinolone transport system permease protein